MQRLTHGLDGFNRFSLQQGVAALMLWPGNADRHAALQELVGARGGTLSSRRRRELPALGSCALCCARRWQCFEDACRKASACVPDLKGHKLVSGAVIVSKATRHSLADDIVGLAGWEPGDVGVRVVVDEHAQQG